MKAKNLSKALLVGTARMLTSASDFLLRITEKNLPEDRSTTLADVRRDVPEDYDLNTDQWPEAWARRIADAKHVTWFSFNAKKGMNIQPAKPGPKTDHQVEKKHIPAPPKVHSGPLEEIQQELKIRTHGRKKETPPGKPAILNDSVEVPRIFDSKKRLWLRKADKKPTPHEHKSGNPEMNLPETSSPGIESHEEHKAFTKQKMQVKNAGLKSEEPLDMSIPEKSKTDTRPEPTPARRGVQHDHVLQGSPGKPPGKAGWQDPMDTLRFPEPVPYTDDLTIPKPSQGIDMGEVPPFSHRWPDFAVNNKPSSTSVKPFVSYITEEPGKTYAERKTVFRNESAPEQEKPWPELENFEPHPELTESEKSPENQGRFLRLQQEQKGSLWSVLRF